MHYIVYKTTNNVNNKIYIGKHQTKDLNDDYLGSGKILSYAIQKYGKEKFTREILYEFDNDEEMNLMEAQIVDEEFVSRTDTYNIKLGGQGGWDHFKGTVNVKDKTGKRFNISKTDIRYINGEVNSIAKNTILTKDKNGDIFRVLIYDPRYLSGELVGITKGRSISEDHKQKISKANSKRQKGKDNSMYGMTWIYNTKEERSIRVPKEEVQKWIEKGWNRGRKMKF